MSEITLRTATPSDIFTLLPMMREFNRLEDIDVEPVLHHEALGTLLERPDFGRVFERAAAADDVKAIHLMVRPENAIAQRLYLASGYAPPTRLMLGKVLPPCAPRGTRGSA